MTIFHAQARPATGAGTSPQATFTNPPTAENLLVAMVSVQGARTLTVNSAAGWMPLGGTPLTSGDTGGLYYKIAGENESATQQPVTSDSGSAVWAVVIAEYGGILLSAPVEAQAGNTDNDATKTTTGTADPVDGVERLIVGGAFTTSNSIWSGQAVNGSTNGVTVRGGPGTGSANNQTACTLFDKIDTDTVSGNYTVRAITSISGAGAAFIAIFRYTPLPTMRAVRPERTGIRTIPVAEIGASRGAIAVGSRRDIKVG